MINHGFLWFRAFAPACLLTGAVLLAGCSRSSESQAGPARAASTTLTAEVSVENGDIVVFNKDGFQWLNTEIAVNPDDGGGYRCQAGTVDPIAKIALPASKFVNASGQSLDPASTPPARAAITCDTPDGSRSFEGPLK